MPQLIYSIAAAGYASVELPPCGKAIYAPPCIIFCLVVLRYNTYTGVREAGLTGRGCRYVVIASEAAGMDYCMQASTAVDA